MKHLLLLVLLCGVLLFGACVSDRPPDNGTPEPPALNGTFTSEGGTLTFNGDGRAIRLDLSEELAAKTGLPAGEQTGTYVFLYHNGEYRYDLAEYFRIMIGEEHWQFPLHAGEMKEDTVVFYTLEDREKIQFKKG